MSKQQQQQKPWSCNTFQRNSLRTKIKSKVQPTKRYLKVTNPVKDVAVQPFAKTLGRHEAISSRPYHLSKRVSKIQKTSLFSKTKGFLRILCVLYVYMCVSGNQTQGVTHLWATSPGPLRILKVQLIELRFLRIYPTELQLTVQSGEGPCSNRLADVVLTIRVNANEIHMKLAYFLRELYHWIYQ